MTDEQLERILELDGKAGSGSLALAWIQQVAGMWSETGWNISVPKHCLQEVLEQRSQAAREIIELRNKLKVATDCLKAVQIESNRMAVVEMAVEALAAMGEK